MWWGKVICPLTSARICQSLLVASKPPAGVFLWFPRTASAPLTKLMNCGLTPLPVPLLVPTMAYWSIKQNFKSIEWKCGRRFQSLYKAHYFNNQKQFECGTENKPLFVTLQKTLKRLTETVVDAFQSFHIVYHYFNKKKKITKNSNYFDCQTQQKLLIEQTTKDTWNISKRLGENCRRGLFNNAVYHSCISTRLSKDSDHSLQTIRDSQCQISKSFWKTKIETEHTPHRHVPKNCCEF